MGKDVKKEHGQQRGHLLVLSPARTRKGKANLAGDLPGEIDRGKSLPEEREK